MHAKGSSIHGQQLGGRIHTLTSTAPKVSYQQWGRGSVVGFQWTRSNDPLSKTGWWILLACNGVVQHAPKTLARGVGQNVASLKLCTSKCLAGEVVL